MKATIRNLTLTPMMLCSALLLASAIANAQAPTDKELAKKWRKFKYPEVVVVDKDEGESKGSALVHELIPELVPFIEEIALGVCRTLYKHPREVPVFEQLTFELEHRDGVAYKSGDPPRIRINLSTKYLEGQYERMGDEAITYEIAGVNWHELTHAYQLGPKNAGGYRSGTDHFGFVEGTADAVRILAGFHETRKPRPGGHWNSGYTTTGFFVVWLNQTRDPDFLYKLNQTCKTLDPWTWDGALQSIFGEDATVSGLWDEYQHHLKGGGPEAVARFDKGQSVVCKGQSVRFRNTSFNSPISYTWKFEGGSPTRSTEESPEVTFRKSGTYDVSLVAKNKHGSTTKRVPSCIHVLDRTGEVIDLLEPAGEIGHESGTRSMPGEGIDNLLDGDPKTKFCVKANKTRIEYVLPAKRELYSYSLTSANDAPGRDPVQWTLEASNDKKKWTELDRQKNQSFEKRHETRLYVVDCRKAYRFYRWNFEAKSDPIFQIADLGMLGVAQK